MINRVFFALFDPIVMGLYGMLITYIVGGAVMNSLPGNMDSLTITFALSSSLVIGYLLIRGLIKKEKVSQLY